MADQYGISEEELKILKVQAARRAAMRREFMKQSTHPWKHATGESGYLFDPAVQRFLSMKVTQVEHFQTTPKNAFFGIFAVIVPITLFGYLMHRERDAREKKIRNGEIPYRERGFKFQ